MRLDQGNRLLLGTVLLLAALLAVWAGLKLRPASSSWSVAPFSYWEVQGLTLEDRAGKVEFLRSEGGWVLAGQETARVDSETVRALISIWEDGFTPDRLVEGDFEELGLGSEARRLQLSGEAGQVLLDVDLGRRIRGGRTYVRPHGGQQVFQGVVPPGPQVSTRAEDWVAPQPPSD